MSVRVGDEIVAGSSGDVYTKTQVDALIAAAVAQTTEKPGMIKPFAGTTVPTGYLLCDGSAVSRTTYADLFAAIGTTYGTGDGSTTFNLPNYSIKYLTNRPPVKTRSTDHTTAPETSLHFRKKGGGNITTNVYAGIKAESGGFGHLVNASTPTGGGFPSSPNDYVPSNLYADFSASNSKTALMIIKY